jgi:hypothetical protein
MYVPACVCVFCRCAAEYHTNVTFYVTTHECDFLCMCLRVYVCILQVWGGSGSRESKGGGGGGVKGFEARILNAFLRPPPPPPLRPPPPPPLSSAASPSLRPRPPLPLFLLPAPLSESIKGYPSKICILQE